jgi:hypothetical protein
MTTYKISVNQQYRGETRELTPIPLMSESGIGKVPLKLINVFPTHLTAGDPEGDSHPVVDACDNFLEYLALRWIPRSPRSSRCFANDTSITDVIPISTQRHSKRQYLNYAVLVVSQVFDTIVFSLQFERR